MITLKWTVLDKYQMVCTEMKIRWECDQNFQGLFTSIRMCPQKSKRDKMLLVAKH